MNKAELMQLPFEVLFEAITPKYSVGKTEFKDPNIKYFCYNYYCSMSELIDCNDIDESEYDFTYYEEGNSKVYYGPSLKEVMVNCIIGEKYEIKNV